MTRSTLTALDLIPLDEMYEVSTLVCLRSSQKKRHERKKLRSFRKISTEKIPMSSLSCCCTASSFSWASVARSVANWFGVSGATAGTLFTAIEKWSTHCWMQANYNAHSNYKKRQTYLRHFIQNTKIVTHLSQPVYMTSFSYMTLSPLLQCCARIRQILAIEMTIFRGRGFHIWFCLSVRWWPHHRADVSTLF